jgi:hypothetical protein
MYCRQTIEAGGILWQEYGYSPEIPEPEPSDIYQMGMDDGEANVEPTLPESLEYWDGYCFGLRTHWLKVQSKEELAIPEI